MWGERKHRGKWSGESSLRWPEQHPGGRGEWKENLAERGDLEAVLSATIRDAPSPGRCCRLEVSGEESAGFWGRVSAGAREKILAACDPEHLAYPSASP